MIGLLRAEMLRFISRRLFRFLGVAAVAGILAAATIAFLQSSKDPDAGLADARRDIAACEAERRVFENEAGIKPIEGFQCPTVRELRDAYDRRLVYVETMPMATRGLAIAFFVLSIVVAASFVGADWGTGSTTTLLTWESRRGRVLVAKFVVAAAALALSTALLLALLDIVYLPVAVFRGTTEGLTQSVWWTLAGVWARGAGLAVFGAAVATSIATIARNTVAVVGVAFAYGVILDPILGAIRRGSFRPWLLQHNVPRLLGFENVPQADPSPGALFAEQAVRLGPLRPSVLFAIYAAALLAIAYAAFRARDVT